MGHHGGYYLKKFIGTFSVFGDTLPSHCFYSMAPLSVSNPTFARYDSDGGMVVSVFGLLGGIAASYTAVCELLDAKMAPPCYVQWFTTGLHVAVSSGASTHCCGPFMNLTVSGADPLHVCL
ncbi:unnamed protein product [Haemonchus placei]|uniref:Ammonium_transp domain-containing protein n=1 Tax=Haemonchus placei TaxID=6290 RepID=A0A0N4VUN1_HAEPC|nr:unnamed protein product [Haemonchus placei]